MWRTVASLLLLLQLGVPSHLGAQEPLQPPRHWTLDSTSLARATAGLQAREAASHETSRWSRVIKLSPGRDVFIETDALPPHARVFVHADDTRLVVLNTSAVPKAIARLALESAKRDGRTFDEVRTRRSYRRGAARLGPDGAFLDGQRVADITALVQDIRRQDVRLVTVTAEAAKGALTGVGVALLFAGGAVNAAACRCSEPMPTLPGLALTMSGFGVLIRAAGAPDHIAGPQRIIYQR